MFLNPGCLVTNLTTSQHIHGFFSSLCYNRRDHPVVLQNFAPWILGLFISIPTNTKVDI